MSGKTQYITFDISQDEFPPAYHKYIEANQSVFLVIGNSGSAKSGFFYRRLIAFALGLPYFRCVYTRKVKDTIRDSIFLGLKDVIEDWGLKGYFKIKENEMDIVCKLNGNMLLSFGLDDPKKLKSIKDPSHWFWDEFDESTLQDYSEIRRRLRTNKVKKTQFMAALNPVAGWWGKEHFFPEQFHEEIPIGEVPAITHDTLILKTSYHDNPFVDREEILMKNKELALLDENNWIVYEEGNWGKLTSGGEFYKTFKRREHVKPVKYNPSLATHLSLDFNVLPYMTNVCANVELEVRNQVEYHYYVRIYKEYCLKDPLNTTEACIKAWIEDYGHTNPDVFYYGDAMGNKRHEGQGSKTEFKTVKELLARWIDEGSDRTNRHNPSVLKSREFINRMLAGLPIAENVFVHVEIDPSCKELISDMENVVLGVDGKLKKKVKDKKTNQVYEQYGHTSDALSYMLVKLFEDIFKNYKS